MRVDTFNGNLASARYVSAALLAAFTCDARAENTAGTAIVNVAQLTATGRNIPIASNESRIIVAERLDVALATGPTQAPTGDSTVIAATVTNQGNGREAFAITATASPAANLRIAIDGDGDGRYDPARDPMVTDGRTPVLGPGQSITLFVLAPGAATGALTIGATAVTGSGTPGTGFSGTGDGGGDAVTGPTSASATLVVPLTPLDPAAPTLAKSASVAAPDGSTRAVRGATITYTLTARFPAATQAPRITDAIPVGTTYTPASLRLDEVALSDAADNDAGEASAARIAIALPDQAAGVTRTVRFQVVIQ